MKYYTKQSAILMLQDGSVIYGSSIGKKGTRGGEICFNTGMTGYQESFTDPSYYGQVVMDTNAHTGNYDVMKLEQEFGIPPIIGLVVNTFSPLNSRKTADDRLQDYLEKNGIVGISDIDTRRFVRHTVPENQNDEAIRGFKAKGKRPFQFSTTRILLPDHMTSVIFLINLLTI